MQSRRAFAICLLLFCLISTLAVTQVYQVTDLGQLSPTAINDGGQVVGNQNGQASSWTQSAGPKGLGTLTGGTSSYAQSINDLGAIVGTADGPGTVISSSSGYPNVQCDDLTQPFVWTTSNGMQGLGTAGTVADPFYSDWCDFSFYGTGINDLGQVVGYSTPEPDLYQWDFLWTSAGSMSIFGSGWTPTFANGVSSTGQIVGQSLGEIGNAASWKNGVQTTLVDLGAGAGLEYTSSANGVNDQGQAVGWSTTIPFDPDCGLDLTGCPIHAVLWAPNGGITDLGTLSGDTLSTATNINFFGQVIGSSGSTLGTLPLGAPGGAGFDGGDPITVIGRPYVWTQTTGMQDLNTLIPANSGWVLNAATGINIWGQIVGSGTLNGESHGFLLTPASSNETQTVSGLTTEPTVSSSLNPSLFNQQVTFTATVTGQSGTGQSGGTPTGTVTFSDGSFILGTVPLSGDTAIFSTSALSGGIHPVNAFYSGDSNFIGGAGSLNQVVTQANTMLTLIPSVNPSGFGQPVTFTTTITTLYGGQATGTVTFKDGTTTLGSSAVSGNTASLTTSSLAFGIHSITAVYSGDSNFFGSASNTLSQIVRAATTITLLSSINPSVQDKSVTFTATVSSLAATRTGTVQFLNGTAALATVTLKSGTAKLTTSQLPPGPNPITAVYSGDTNNSANISGTVNQLVQAPTTITLTSSLGSSAYGQAVIFTGEVTSSIGAPPDGEAITFKQGSTVLGTGILSSGMASISISTLGVGDKTITAVYGGDANLTSSKSEVLSQVVGKATTTTTLLSSMNSSNYKQSVTFTATVVPQFGGTVSGSVTFMDGTTTLKTVGLGRGIAQYATSKLAAGTHNITATYNGSTNFTTSSGGLAQTVN